MTDVARDSVRNVLFVCTHNSARSIMAEAIMNHATRTGTAGRFLAFSAGSQPSGEVSPYALRALDALRIPRGEPRSKDWAEFARPEAPELHFVFTVCDQAAGEACPVWPGQPMTAHWGVPDPSAVQGTDGERLKACIDTAHVLKRRIDLMLALPLASLDRMAIQRAISEIGRH
jgi:arsenate reductase